MSASTSKDTTINEQPIFVGRDTGRLIYLCKDGLYALVAENIADLYAALAEEASVGPHPFHGRVTAIRVNGIHADRLIRTDQMPPVAAPRDRTLDHAIVINEWANWCEAVAEVADDCDGDDYLRALERGTREAWAIEDAAALERVQLVAAREDLDEALEECAPRLSRADLIKVRSFVTTLASKGRALAVA